MKNIFLTIFYFIKYLDKGIIYCVLFFVIWAIIFSVGGFLGVKHLFYDDFEMQMMAKGEFPYKQSPFLYYSSTFLGYFYVFLYSNFGFIEWYNFLYLFLVSFSFSFLFFIFIIRLKKQYILKLLPFLILFFWIFLLKFLTNVQFTFASGLLAGNAYICLYIVNTHKFKRHNFLISICYFLLLFSCLYRYQMFVLVSVLFITIFYILEIFNKLSKENNVFKFRKSALIFVLPVFIGYGLHTLDSHLLNHQEKDFVTFHTNRGKIGDYLILSKAKNKKELVDSVNWKDEDLKIIRTWAYLDFKQFRLKPVEYIGNNADLSSYYSFGNLIRQFRYSLNDTIYRNTFLICFLLLILIMSIYFDSSRFLLVYSLSIQVFIIFIILILAVVLKIPESHVVLPIYSLVFLWLVWHNFKKGTNGRDVMANRVPILIGSFFAFFLMFQNFRLTHFAELKDRENVYLLDKEIFKHGVTDIYSLPTNYPGYSHNSKIMQEKRIKPKVFYCGLFFNHSSNIAFNYLWKETSFISKLDSGIYFYFRQDRKYQMDIFKEGLTTIMNRDFNISIENEEIKLGDELGYLLKLKTADKRNGELHDVN